MTYVSGDGKASDRQWMSGEQSDRQRMREVTGFAEWSVKWWSSEVVYSG